MWSYYNFEQQLELNTDIIIDINTMNDAFESYSYLFPHWLQFWWIASSLVQFPQNYKGNKFQLMV